MESISVFQEFIAKSRYARFLSEKKRREHFSETTSRYINFMIEYVAEKYKFEINADLQNEIFATISGMEVMPSMRAMMTAGKALARDNTCAYNCLGFDTLVTTLEHGIVKIGELVDKEVHIVDGNGEWVKATCHSYGKQQLYNIEFVTSGKGKFSIRATDNHRWILTNGKEITTSELTKKHRLATSHFKREVVEIDDDYGKGVQHGIIYGDGTANYSILRNKKTTYTEKRCTGFFVRLCGTSRELLSYFSEYKHSYPKTYNGDPVVYIYDRALDLKDLPPEHVSNSYLLGFLRGWLAADGSVTTVGGQVTLATNEKGYEWLLKFGTKLGFVSANYRIDERETNFGKRKEPLYVISLDRRYLIKDDFLLLYKRDKFTQIDIKKNPGFGKIKSVEPSSIEEVYCFDVPTTHSFLLIRNLLTGNCSYLPVDDQKAFDEAMLILMCGSGVGFSVERQYVNQLPEIPERLYDAEDTIVVHDSKEGWAKALRKLIANLYAGEIPCWDLSKLRPAGAPLKTFGGRASGPGPLDELFKFVIDTFKGAVGRKLTSIECHDIMCKIAEVVVVGGVRRSAMISLSNLSDDRMRHAKNGQWWVADPQRALSNNSAVYTEKPDVGAFLKEWLSIYESKSGERGIFSRAAAKKLAQKNGRRDPNYDFGCNPCSEIILRPYQFCNLTEAVVRAEDTKETLTRKVKIAAILGTIQATLSHFPYLRKMWQKNVEEERLLGVSLTGIYDSNLMNDYSDEDLPELLEDLKGVTVETNKEWADILGIKQAAAVTCVKPSGTVSSLVDCASGIHPRWARYYFRRVRADNKDPLTNFLKASGVPYEPDVMKPDYTTVFTFPMQAPEGALTRDDISAIDHLELWLVYQYHWCEHKPSVTINVKDHEWPRVGAWVYDNFDEMSGVSFLPYDGGTYRQAPHEAVSKEKYESMVEKMPTHIDWDSLVEKVDSVEGVQQLACSGGNCDI